MDLRYRLAVVTGAGDGRGREVAVALGRVGAAVLAVDRDLADAEETAARVRRSRVSAWALQADPAEEAEQRLLADLARDLGGMDLLVTCVRGRSVGLPSPYEQWPEATAEAWSRTLDLELRAPIRLTQLFVTGLAERRGRRDGTPAVVHVGSGAAASPVHAAALAGLAGFTRCLTDPASTGGARVMAVVPGPAGWDASLDPPGRPVPVARVVVDLLRAGTAGQVVALGGPPPVAPAANGPTWTGGDR